MTTSGPLLDRCVAVAARAPSPHNTQPWSPRVVADRVEVAVVPGRVLWAGDPSFRDLLLALGAWVESFAVAAAAEGHGVLVEPTPYLQRLHELPTRGPADPERPVLVVRLDGTATARHTPADVLGRRVHRGALTAGPDIWSDLPDLPSWLAVREVDTATMDHLVRLGAAGTWGHRAVAVELVQWLRLREDHPRYALDGMTDRMLGLSPVVGRAAAPLTRHPRLRDPALAVAGALARRLEALARGPGRPVDQAPGGVRPTAVRGLALAGHPRGGESGPRHLVLVADTRAAGSDASGVHSLTEAMDGALGMPEEHAVEAGRVLQRLWLDAHRAAMAVYPHSEAIDSPHAHAALRRRLGLRRAEVALSVFSVGLPVGPVARSPRLTDRLTD